MQSVSDEYIEAVQAGDYHKLNDVRTRQTAVLDQVNAHLRRTRHMTRQFIVAVMVMNAVLGVWGFVYEHWLSVWLGVLSIPMLYSVRRRLPPL